MSGGIWVGWVYRPEADGFWVEGPQDLSAIWAQAFFPSDARVLWVDAHGRTTELRWADLPGHSQVPAGERVRLPADPEGSGPMTYVVARLRDGDGCPWDREQTPLSLVRYLLDEAYEAAAAVTAEDWDLVQDELGDVLLQVVLQAQIQAEAGRFDFDRVAAAQARKLTDRHPHVFAGQPVASSQEVLAAWEGHKARERHRGHGDERVMPALMAYSRALKRGEVGLDDAAVAYLDGLIEDGSELSAGERRELLADWIGAAVAAARTWHEEAEWVLKSDLDERRKSL